MHEYLSRVKADRRRWDSVKQTVQQDIHTTALILLVYIITITNITRCTKVQIKLFLLFLWNETCWHNLWHRQSALPCWAAPWVLSPLVSNHFSSIINVYSINYHWRWSVCHISFAWHLLLFWPPSRPANLIAVSLPGGHPIYTIQHLTKSYTKCDLQLKRAFWKWGVVGYWPFLSCSWLLGSASTGGQRNFGLVLIDKCQVLGNTVMESKVKDCLFIVSDQMKFNSVKWLSTDRKIKFEASAVHQ